MQGDIALVGFVLTAEEWRELDPRSRAELLAAAFQRDAPWVVAPLASVLSQPIALDDER
jgi:hypothetical protein